MTTKEQFVDQSASSESPVTRIARLEHELAVATERAAVAEEQLKRVHIAVRAFKQSQTNAQARREDLMQSARKHAQEIVRKAKTEVEKLESAPAAKSASLYNSWLVSDPSLDERLDDYLQSEFEPDRSRDWMLSDDNAK
jgi:cell division septum initiation protein DivIVA